MPLDQWSYYFAQEEENENYTQLVFSYERIKLRYLD